METNNSGTFAVGDVVVWKGRIGLVQTIVKGSICPVIVCFVSDAFPNTEHGSRVRFTSEGHYMSNLRRHEKLTKTHSTVELV